jgi:hypothetical protein
MPAAVYGAPRDVKHENIRNLCEHNMLWCCEAANREKMAVPGADQKTETEKE